jgi:hypothetical protein
MHPRLTCLLGAGAIPALVLAGAVASAPAAGAATGPQLRHAVQTTLCASTSNPNCAQTLTAQIPAGTALSVTCDHGGDYYVVVTAHQNQEGYVPESDVSGAPTTLSDCDTSAHQAIWAAALAIGYIGNSTAWPPNSCLGFVATMWRDTGATLAPGTTPVPWWNATTLAKHTMKNDPDGYLTPPRGALAFWSDNSQVGHVVISVGNGWTISTAEGSTPGTDAVHVLSIGHRNSDGYASSYLGWVMP